MLHSNEHNLRQDSAKPRFLSKERHSLYIIIFVYIFLQRENTYILVEVINIIEQQILDFE